MFRIDVRHRGVLRSISAENKYKKVLLILFK